MNNVYETMTSLRRDEKLHAIALYTEASGYGATYCGIRVLPSDVPTPATVDCEACQRHMDGRWLRRMAKLEAESGGP